MKRPMMNALKQKWKDFICWFIDNQGYSNLYIKKCEMKFVTYYKTNRRHDIDNGTPKFLLDGLSESGFIIDDDSKHITKLTMECYVDKENPRTEITVNILIKGDKRNMKILKFVERYNNMANQQLKDRFIKEKIKITPYVSIIKKDVYAQLIVDKTTFEQESYDDNGVIKYRKTDKIRVNSVAQYVQFCRAVIELYTDLEIDEDDKGFIKGYDALKSSGLLDILMVGSDKADPLIPMSELSEFKTILTMKQSDTQFNETTTQAFISKQIGRISDLANATLTPLMDVVSKKLDEIPKEDLEGKILEFAKKGNFKEV